MSYNRYNSWNHQNKPHSWNEPYHSHHSHHSQHSQHSQHWSKESNRWEQSDRWNQRSTAPLLHSIPSGRPLYRRYRDESRFRVENNPTRDQETPRRLPVTVKQEKSSDADDYEKFKEIQPQTTISSENNKQHESNEVPKQRLQSQSSVNEEETRIGSEKLKRPDEPIQSEPQVRIKKSKRLKVTESLDESADSVLHVPIETPRLDLTIADSENLEDQDESIQSESHIPSKKSKRKKSKDLENPEKSTPVEQRKASHHCYNSFTTKFIRIYRSNRCLWDPNCRNVTHKAKKKAIKSLMECCDNFQMQADEKFIINKISNFRYRFKREHSKIEEKKKNGEEYVSSWWCYDLLTFLIPYTTKEEEILIGSEDEMHAEADSTNLTMRSPNHSMDLNRKENDVTPLNTPIASTPTSRNDTESNKTVDEFEAIGISVAAKLRKMSNLQMLHAEILIFQVLKMGMLNNLSDSTSIKK